MTVAPPDGTPDPDPTGEPDATGGSLPAGPVVVVGTGLVGTSVALALTAAGSSVLLSDTDPAAVAVAVTRGAGVAEAPGDPAGHADAGHADAGHADDDVGLVVVAVPPAAVAAVVLERLARHPAAVVTDVSSVKALPLRTLLSGPAELDRYVGGHPMAGSERSGPAAARGDLFAGRPWAVTPNPQSRPSAVAAVHRLARVTGAVPVTLDADGHDQAVAAVSHLPHVAASAVAAQLAAAPGATLALTGPGLRDVTRIAAGSPALWTDILTANAGPVAAGIRGLRDGLARFLDALDGVSAGQPDAPARLGELLQRGVDGTARLPGRHGTEPERFGVLGVVVDDRPGQLARLFAAVDAAGGNVADFRLDHRAGQAAGQVQLSVEPAAVEPLAAALAAVGWTVHPGGDDRAD